MVDPSIIISQCYNSVGCRMFVTLVGKHRKIHSFSLLYKMDVYNSLYDPESKPSCWPFHLLLLDDNRLANPWSQCHIFCKVHIWLASSFLHLLGNETSPHWGRCRKILFPGVCRRWFSLFHLSEVSSLNILNSYIKEKKLLSKTKALHRHNL